MLGCRLYPMLGVSSHPLLGVLLHPMLGVFCTPRVRSHYTPQVWVFCTPRVGICRTPQAGVVAVGVMRFAAQPCKGDIPQPGVSTPGVGVRVLFYRSPVGAALCCIRLVVSFIIIPPLQGYMSFVCPLFFPGLHPGLCNVAPAGLVRHPYYAPVSPGLPPWAG